MNNDDIILLSDVDKTQIRERLLKLPKLDIFNVSDTIYQEVDVARKCIPDEILRVLFSFRKRSNQEGRLIIRNLPIDSNLPKTPELGEISTEKQTYISEYILLLFASLLGDPISYSDEKEGALIQNVCPVKGCEEKQENSGSYNLSFHTESGLHPFKPDYLGLFCLKANHEKDAATRTSSIRNCLRQLPSSAIELLREKLFKLKAPSSFKKHELFETTVAILSGNILDPDLLIDFALMEGLTEQAQWALECIFNELEKQSVGHVLLPGDLLLIDNRKSVHGRTFFKPRYDGNDRWLQRILVTKEFHKTAAGRSVEGHTYHPLYVENVRNG